MELLKALFALLLITIITISILKVVDLMAAWYTNQGRPLASNISSNIHEQLTGEGINASEYDLWERTKPYLEPLDIALVFAFLASLVATFIYSRERT